MHTLVTAHDGIRRAGVDTQGAADTPVLINVNSLAWTLQAKYGVQRLFWPASDVGKAGDTLLTARRTLVDVGFSCFYGAAVARTVRVPATRALSLRQRIQDAGSQLPVGQRRGAHFLLVMRLATIFLVAGRAVFARAATTIGCFLGVAFVVVCGAAGTLFTW